MPAPKKLIEVALPLEEINKAAAREKSIRHGHPSTLHLWWARRPLAAARAVIWSSLVDDPSSHPDQFPTEEAQNKERERLFDILKELVVWENSNNEEVLNKAKAEILKSTNGNPPALLDPFAGGGSIPLEAQRLGLEAHAHDLNPVAVLINKAMIEIPAQFANLPPVNPSVPKEQRTSDKWKGAKGLAEDVRYYGEMLKAEAFKRIGYLYPKVKVPEEQGGGEATVIAWIWARTVKCPNPACGCEVPLVRSFVLCKKKGKEVWVEPTCDGKQINFTVKQGKCPEGKESNKAGHGAVFRCPVCNTVTTDDYVKRESYENRLSQVLMAIVTEGKKGRVYVSPNCEHSQSANIKKPKYYPTGEIPKNPRWFSPPTFGLIYYDQLFTNRQLTMLTTFIDLLSNVQEKVEKDVYAFRKDFIGINKHISYAQAICVYLALLVDKLTDYHSSICTWDNSRDLIGHTFGRQAIPMTWDYAEGNPFSTSSGCFSNFLNRFVESIVRLPIDKKGKVVLQKDAREDARLKNVVIATDPPYYDNIGYADLSDYFYVWLRHSLQRIYPNLFQKILTPKKEELIASPYRFNGNAKVARDFFEEGMAETCRNLYNYSQSDVPTTIYYAYKSNEVQTNSKTSYTAVSSVGWETMLTAIINAGFAITGTWPIRTEMANRSVAMGTNALASSIILVCRKRPSDAGVCTRKNFIAALKRELRPALDTMVKSAMAPTDLAQSAIGPGMAIYSRYSQVLDASGAPLTVRDALGIINRELDLYFHDQSDALDKNSRFCVDMYSNNEFGEIKSGEAELLANAKGTSLASLVSSGVLYAKGGVTRLLRREELSLDVRVDEPTTWLLCQQLVQAFASGGIELCASVVARFDNTKPEDAKDLAYRLYQLADRKGWTQEAYAYNALVSLWSSVQERARDTREKNAGRFLFDKNGD